MTRKTSEVSRDVIFDQNYWQPKMKQESRPWLINKEENDTDKSQYK